MNGGISSQLIISTACTERELEVAGVAAHPDLTENSSKSSCVLIRVVTVIITTIILEFVPWKTTAAVIHRRAQW